MVKEKEMTEYEKAIEMGKEVAEIFKRLNFEGKRAIFYYGQGLLVGGMEEHKLPKIIL